MEDIHVWPDGTWCFGEDLEEMLAPPCAKSDDYQTLEFDSQEWHAHVDREV